MYVPPAFAEEDLRRLHEMMRQHSFATLVSQGSEGPQASHLPFLFDPERGPRGTLLCHMARANPQWRQFGEEAEALVIFQGPHAYISPSWYQTELSVPTWNYVAVHAYGRPKILAEPEEAAQVLGLLTAVHEAHLPQPWSPHRLPADFVRRLLKGIVAFEIEITRLEGKFKLGQNRSAEDRAGVVKALEAEDDPLARAVAQLMGEEPV